MAPSTNKNSLLSDYEVFPSWTRGDETEDESDGIRLGVQRQKKRRDRRSEPSEEAVIRAETHQIDAATEFNDLEPTAPLDDLPLPSSTTTTEGAPGPTDAMSTVTLAVPSDEASSTTTTTTTSATTTTSTTTTSETIPPQDQITEAPTVSDS